MLRPGHINRDPLKIFEGKALISDGEAARKGSGYFYHILGVVTPH